MLFDTANISLDELNAPLLQQKKITLHILRLDKIHPVVSGNKLFKLHYYLEDALKEPKKSLVTFGGAYSNHLVATAFACHQLKLDCTGMVRGEKPSELSHTLLACLQLGMKLEFLSREKYAILSQEDRSNATTIVIPEGGYHPTGAKGAALIMNMIPDDTTHICTATGTATTLAGLAINATHTKTIISIPVLKGFTDVPERVQFLTQKELGPNLIVWGDYHFGGYAKKTNELIHYMNDVYKQFQLPTDFVYTAKMIWGVFDQLKRDFFPEGSKIVCLHTGGLQGNDSLPKGSLIF
jgi:1-aminocyclopropane-1-carboxylate deaminase/D-cysteine desulfhydrase-like pyridoxal-dependent ACC family enzyme